ncbi:MAG: tetratricopeptide repeat protein [Planctomycetota bacterium]
MRKFSALIPALLLVASPVLADPAPEHEAQREQASQAYSAGNWQQVIKTTSGILEQNAKDNIALHLRGTSRIELGILTGDAAMIRGGITDTRQAISAASEPDFNYYLPYLYGMTSLTRLEDQPQHAQVTVNVAGQLLQTATINAEQKANVYYQRGLAHAALKKTPEAAADFKSAIGEFPEHLAAYMAMADAYAEADQDAEVLQTYQQAAAAFPKEPLVDNNRGMFHMNRKQYNDAIRAFSAALQKNPKYDIALTNRGYVWLEGGRPKEAEKDLTASLQLNADQPGVRRMLGTARLVQGRWQEAVEDYNAVIKAMPNDPYIHADAGFAKFFGRDYAGALAEFNAVIQISPDAQFINPWRTWTLLKLGRKAEATGIAQSSRSRSEKERNWIDWVILYHIGDISDADLLNNVERTDPAIQTAQLCEARFFIAEHQLSQGQRQEAAASYQQALATNKRQLSAWRGASYALRKFQ